MSVWLKKARYNDEGYIDLLDCSSIGIVDSYEAYIDSPKAVVSLSAGYFTGFANTVEMDIFYSKDGVHYTKAFATSTGEYWKLGFGIRYPIREFWTKNKKTKLLNRCQNICARADLHFSCIY